MLDNAVRLVSAFLLHPMHGVNVITQSLPRTTLNSAPDDPAPPVVPVENDSDNESVAKDLTPSAVPALVVWGDSSVSIKLSKGNLIAREVAIAIGYVTSDTADALGAVRDCGYIMRGLILSLKRFNSQSNSAGYRELNGIKILELSEGEEQRITAAVGRFKMWGFVIVRAIVIETLA